MQPHIGQKQGGGIRVGIESLVIIFENCDPWLKLAYGRTRLPLSLVSCFIARLVVEVFDSGFVEESAFIAAQAIKVQRNF